MKILMLHPRASDVKSFLKLTMLPETLAENLEWNDDAPDILFCSEWIYYKSKYFRKFKKLYGKPGLKVQFLGEAIHPDFNLFDYSVGFGDEFNDDSRFIRLPSPWDMFSGFVSVRKNAITTIEEARAELSRKSGFCDFLYSNPQANPMRDRMFREISKYKRVDSLGRHLNNVEVPGTGYSGHSKECAPKKAPFKFSIAAENSDYRGYTSEKLLTSLEAHTVPVYWGNPDVEDDINPSCFVNAGKFDGFPSLLEEIERLDKDDEAWERMVSEPWMTMEQEARSEARTKNYLHLMTDLLKGNMPPKVPQGYHVYLYRERFFDGSFPFDSLKDRVKNMFSE